MCRFKVDGARAVADRAFVTALAYTGARDRACNLDVGDVDLRHAKFRIADSKTDAGVREVYLTPDLVEVIAEYFATGFPCSGRLRRSQTERHAQQDQANKQTMVPAVRLANEWRADRGEQPLPHVTPHTLRHTYISLAFEANFPLPYVMELVGHDDSRTTTDIYAKVNRRRNRAAQAQAFDRLVADGCRHVAPQPNRLGTPLRGTGSWRAAA